MGFWASRLTGDAKTDRAFLNLRTFFATPGARARTVAVAPVALPAPSR